MMHSTHETIIRRYRARSGVPLVKKKYIKNGIYKWPRIVLGQLGEINQISRGLSSGSEQFILGLAIIRYNSSFSYHSGREVVCLLLDASQRALQVFISSCFLLDKGPPSSDLRINLRPPDEPLPGKAVVPGQHLGCELSDGGLATFLKGGYWNMNDNGLFN